MPDKDKGLLFHYTSQVGLLGILKDQEIWATNINFLNDCKEFKHALELTKGIIIETPDLNPLVKDNLLDIFDTIKEIISPDACIYVTSFSERGDLLSQWRGYCNEGCGYSIGLDQSVLQQIATENDVNLFKCIYDLEEQIKELKIYFDWALTSCSTNVSNISISDINKIIGNLLEMLFITSPKFKDKSFSEEKEWRLVSKTVDFTDDRVEFRQGKSTLIPYIKIPLVPANTDNVPVNKIYVGPTPDMDLAKLAATSLLCKLKILSKKVEPSKVPFKNW